MALLIVLAGAGGLWGCKKTDRAWAEASKADSAEAYRAFLRAHPESEQVDTARAKLEIIRRREATRAAIAGAWSEVAEARGKSGAPPGVVLDDAVRAWQEGSAGKTLVPEEEQFLIDVLVASIKKLSADQLASFGGIRPVLTAAPLVVERPLENTTTGVSVKGAPGAAKSGDTVRFGGHMITGPAGTGGRKFMLGTGRCAAPAGALDRENFAASLTVIGVDGLKVEFATELPRDVILFTARPPEFRFPDGDGTVLRFKGRASGLWAGWVFEGDPAAPLVMVLTKQSGLVYVCGKGSVKSPEGRTVALPVGRGGGTAVATAEK